MTTNTNTTEALMEQAQVFASAWALVGSRFDDGSELGNAEEQKRELRAMIESALASAAQPPADDSRTRLLSALERAAIAETALRALTDECDNDSAPGWEERMSACIAEANRVLAAAPKAAKAEPAQREPLIARALDEWHEDDGPVMWWAWCGHSWAGEPAWCGTPNDSDWPGYHTHWTPHPDQPILKEHP